MAKQDQPGTARGGQGRGFCAAAGQVGAARAAAALAVAAAFVGCSVGPTGDDPDRAAFAASGCADIYAPDLLPTFEVTISPEEWAAMQTEYRTWMERQAAGLDLKPYHPIGFRYGTESRDAMMKLQANPSSSWRGEKMEFTVSFNEVDKGGRFHGLRKLVLHAQPSEQTFLRERLGMAFFRSLGLPATCVNNARLVVNGRYYGIYVNRERADDEYLERVFGDSGKGGDLWKGGWELENHPAPLSPVRQNEIMGVADVAMLEGLGDLEQAVSVWAVEAALPDNDGYWAVEHNFFLYDHPTRGFLWLPYDLDATFDFVAVDANPLSWSPPWSPGIGTQQELVLNDSHWRARFVAALGRASAAYDPGWFTDRLARWSSQIGDAVDADTVKPFTSAEARASVAGLRGYFSERARFLRAWLACDAAGGQVGPDAPDGDGDGVPFCGDCNDHDAAIHPGASEMCGNDVDENCNGHRDDC